MNSLIQSVKVMDTYKLSPRAVRCLHTIITNPGICVLDISIKIGLSDRNRVKSQLDGLVERGFIVDRREYKQKAVPVQFYITPAGLELWQRIVG